MSTGFVCPECGLDYDTLHPSDAKVALRSFPRRYRAALASALDDDAGDALVRRRPSPEVWSALEYAAHVADMFDAMATTFRRMYDEDHPTLDLFDADERAASKAYNEQDPVAVLDRIAAGAERMVAALDRVDAKSWQRTASFSWGERDLLTMMRNGVHEGVHHLRDLERSLDTARRTSAG